MTSKNEPSMQEQLAQGAEHFLRSVKKLPKAKQWKQQYKTNEDFGSMDPDLKRLVAVGCTGAGKSTLVNKLGGLHYVCKESQDGKIDFEWNEQPVFEVGCTTEGVTSYTTFANLNYLGKEDRPFVCVDTPGHDDPAGIGLSDASPEGQKAREMITRQAGDLFVKLKRMGFVNGILVLHNDVNSNRLNPATYEVLDKIDQMFSESAGNVWDHVILAYSKCDTDSKGWRANLEKKTKDMQEELKKKFPKCKDIAVPIVPLSSIEFDDKESDASGFEKLWQFLKSKPNMSTENLQKFKGLTSKIETIIAEREFYQRQAEARKFFTNVAMTTLAFIMGFFGIVHPWTNMKSTVFDEVLILAVFVYCIGMVKFYDFLVIFWDDYAVNFLAKKGILSAEATNNFRIIKEKTNKKED